MLLLRKGTYIPQPLGVRIGGEHGAQGGVTPDPIRQRLEPF